jgi:hypothetical protein
VIVLYVSGSRDLAGGEWGVTQSQDMMQWGGRAGVLLFRCSCGAFLSFISSVVTRG